MDRPTIIYAADQTRTGRDPTRLAFLAKRGHLVRIRHGAYVLKEQWELLSEQQKYGLKADALARFVKSEPEFCGFSAAMLWGLPLLNIPHELHILSNAPRRGRSRNGVQTHYAALTGNISKLSGYQLTDKARTAIELSLELPFIESVGIMDAARRPTWSKPVDNWSAWTESLPRGFPVSVAELISLAESLPTAASRKRAQFVIEFSSPLAESLGESISRAQMHLERFPPPTLQNVFTTASGRRFRPDFYWKEAGLVGEFDGKEKYLRQDWSGGQSPGDRVFAEKRREDALRSMGLKVVRWTWAEAISRPRLRKCLLDAGLEPA
ncbi:hypothetical protein RSal33209_3217 [Renibacterium salmoninarum ATCC 33209]|uniref:Transcriptional regulator, AbiEi antitoxin, Type IV TA system n=1 Tax=Renibacterium salmoninarum (strain ATCC 33209 / DSM 20767 / JCM 11484 / NBRC 15589 / NCIMB 2235) TaxID=288705 RepID=A9WUR3_RENSM|nr:type IV toxin-antitoxin system AbiEi family antitoxin domain-containing protein [Renibacterium salmoninarum]ABY24934.1 hypothetical protein RSal33209_3217 [Renibacterium salmoninarum ATCC 33209]